MDKSAGKRAIAEALRESEQRFRALVEGIALVVWETDVSGSTVVQSPNWQAVTGLEVDNIQVPWIEAVHPDDREVVAQQWQACIHHKQLFSCEYRLKCQNQVWRWTQAHAAPILDSRGQPTKWVGMNVDITERKTAEQKLIKNERQMSLALDITRMGFWSLNPATKEVRMDARMRGVWGESSDEELVPLPVVMARIHPEDRPLAAESVNAALNPNSSGYYKPTDYRLIQDDGSIRWVAANGMTLYAGRGEQRQAVELFGTVLDITHRKLIEDSLRESEERLQQLNAELEDRVRDRTQELVASEARLRATAELAEQSSREMRRLALELSRAEERERRRLAQILHDHVQQLLVGAKMRVEALQADAKYRDAQKRLVGVVTVLDMAINATRTLAVALVPPVLQTHGLPTALQWLAVHIRDQHNILVDVEVDQSANPGSEEARDLLFQAAREFLLNVIKHAGVTQARLQLTRAAPRDTTDQVAGETADGDIVLVVTDCGVGFDSQAGAASQTSFGLFHLRERITALGGRLEMHSQPGQGTRVTVRLPE
ncbi:MAG: PAS domain-containing protein [Pirellulaceae bacterium]|nr:PAS domain-containing protein [Pirellulaceae bacterium]